MSIDNQPHIIIIGGGFGGLYAAQKLANTKFKVTLIDKRNHHLFQPLLYQVATGGLSPGDIASPLRAVLSKAANIRVLKAKVEDIIPERRAVILDNGELTYDYLVIATGLQNNYFANAHWEPFAPGLKSVEDALEIRRRILNAFEIAERVENPAEQEAWMNFVIIGGGPTGVELAGALSELAHHTMKNDFRRINPRTANILVLEAKDRILPTYPAYLSEVATDRLENLGVNVMPGSLVTAINPEGVTIDSQQGKQTIAAHTIIWGAGMKASQLGEILEKRAKAKLDHIGRVIVGTDLSLPQDQNIYIIGDLANSKDSNGDPLPGIAPVAMQQGRYVADTLLKRQNNQLVRPFEYRNKGNLAVIGRNDAIADFGWLRFSGFPAWLLWIFVHILYLIEYDSKLLVMIQWAFNYFTRKRGARLITKREASASDLSTLITKLGASSKKNQ